MPPKTPKRTFLTNAQKLELKRFWGEHPDVQLLAVVDWVRERFGVSVGRATLYRIYHAPAESFAAGNAQRKKGRRVKFPELERDILAFYEQSRRDHESGGGAMSDDALLRAAAELRARHGISEAELKLSNGWLHRFKERHALRVAPQAAGGDTASMDDAEVLAQAAPEPVDKSRPKRKPRATQRAIDTSVADADVDTADADDATGSDESELRTEAAGPSVVAVGADIQETLVRGSDTPVTTLETPVSLATASTPAVIRPLTYVSATSADPVAAVGFVKWKLNSGMAHADYFSVDSDGVAILTSAIIQLNVELQHSALSAGTSSVIFKVWAGVELLSQCESSARTEGDRALSVLQLECTLPAQTVIRVEYHGAGVVHSGSRLVLRLLNE